MPADDDFDIEKEVERAVEHFEAIESNRWNQLYAYTHQHTRGLTIAGALFLIGGWAALFIFVSNSSAWLMLTSLGVMYIGLLLLVYAPNRRTLEERRRGRTVVFAAATMLGITALGIVILQLTL